MSSNITTFVLKKIAVAWYCSSNMSHSYPSIKKFVFYLDGTSVWAYWFWWLIRLYFHFKFVTRFCILPGRIAIRVVSSRCNFTVKWVHFINVLWYKEARSLKEFCHKNSETITSEFSNWNAKQKQTGNWNHGYDLYLTVFQLFLNTILNKNHRRGSVKIILAYIFTEIKRNTEEREWFEWYLWYGKS